MNTAIGSAATPISLTFSACSSWCTTGTRFDNAYHFPVSETLFYPYRVPSFADLLSPRRCILMRPILVVCPFVPFMNRARAPHFGSLPPGCPLSHVGHAHRSFVLCQLLVLMSDCRDKTVANSISEASSIVVSLLELSSTFPPCGISMSCPKTPCTIPAGGCLPHSRPVSLYS